VSDWPQGPRFEALNRALDELLVLSDEARDAYLARWRKSHPDDAPLLEKLLSAAEPRRNGVDDVLGRAVARSMATTSPVSGITLGSWRLTRMLGRGGMAEVWYAIGDAAHSGQRAAVKILAGERVSSELIARFAQERRILATLDDPRIARLLDAGVGDDGRPWLAMEFVDGDSIDDWCDLRCLDLAARMRLLREVAMAVHSAHRRLIVHRDIKPANVMITAAGHVKLLDFGIAKLLTPEDDTTGESPTLTHARVLTPQYASPEQFLGEAATTAMDVYQLGALMVYLLTGSRPFQSKSDNLVELAHSVVNEDPPSPSQVWARTERHGTQAASNLRARSTTGPRLRRQLRGDLDAIAQRALARLPSQRYASAQQFADDLDAWLMQQPVRARAPSPMYHLRRFVSRNWFGSVVATLLALVLTAYVITVVVQSDRIQRESELNRLVREYLVELLREADPRFSRAARADGERMIDASLMRARQRFGDQPELLAELLGIAGDVLIGRGNYARGAELTGESLALRRRIDPDDPQLMDMLARHGRALHYIGHYAEAEAALSEADGLWYAHGPAGAAWISLALADVLHSRGDYNRAESVLRRADAAQKVSNAPARLRAELARELGSVLRDAGHIGEARRLQTQAFELMRQQFGPMHGSTLATQAALAQTLAIAGESDSARALADPYLATQIGLYGSHHPVVGISRQTLALLDELDGNHVEAMHKLDSVIGKDFAPIAADNVLHAYARLDRAWIHIALSHDDAARIDLDAAEDRLASIRTGGHPRWASLQLARAVLALRRDDAAAAHTHIERAIAQRETLFGAKHPNTLEAKRWLLSVDRMPIPAPVTGASALDIWRMQWLQSAIEPARTGVAQANLRPEDSATSRIAGRPGPSEPQH
jgi:eukaryotic-like serine/threonine-protein kinase